MNGSDSGGEVRYLEEGWKCRRLAPWRGRRMLREEEG